MRRGIALLLLLAAVVELRAAPPGPVVLRSADGGREISVRITEYDGEKGMFGGFLEGGGRFRSRTSSIAEEDHFKIQVHHQAYRKWLSARRASGFASRLRPVEHLRALGVDEGIDERIVKALRWLSERQNADGSIGTEFPVAMTALALLAYSGHGETAASPEFGVRVRAAIDYLLKCGERNKGVLCSRPDRNLAYEHGIATWALADAYGLHRGLEVELPAATDDAIRKAVAIIVEGQTDGGGWLYSYGSNGVGDLSISVWNLYALASARATGIEFGKTIEFVGVEAALKNARPYLRAALDEDNAGYKYRARDGQKGKWSLTGHGLVGARLTGLELPQRDRSVRFALENRPNSLEGNHDPYPQVTICDALYHVGGGAWRRYREEFFLPIAKAQKADGTWLTKRGHIASLKADGVIYSTCMNVLILQVFFR